MGDTEGFAFFVRPPRDRVRQNFLQADEATPALCAFRMSCLSTPATRIRNDRRGSETFTFEMASTSRMSLFILSEALSGHVKLLERFLEMFLMHPICVAVEFRSYE